MHNFQHVLQGDLLGDLTAMFNINEMKKIIKGIFFLRCKSFNFDNLMGTRVLGFQFIKGEPGS